MVEKAVAQRCGADSYSPRVNEVRERKKNREEWRGRREKEGENGGRADGERGGGGGGER